jgi:hypothetical protein
MKVTRKYNYLRFEALAARITKNYIFWDIAAYFMLVSCLEYSSTMNMEVICFSETYVDFHKTISQDYTTLYPRR